MRQPACHVTEMLFLHQRELQTCCLLRNGSNSRCVCIEERIEREDTVIDWSDSLGFI